MKYSKRKLWQKILYVLGELQCYEDMYILIEDGRFIIMDDSNPGHTWAINATPSLLSEGDEEALQSLANYLSLGDLSEL